MESQGKFMMVSTAQKAIKMNQSYGQDVNDDVPSEAT